MADTDTSKEPRNWNWFQARLRTKLWTSGAFIIGLLVILGVWIGFAFPWWNASQYITQYTPNPEQVLRNLVWLFGSIFGGSLAVLGFVNAIHRTQQKDRELDAAEARLHIEQSSERRKTNAEIFAKSVEQLGHEQMAIRLGGLYSLENLARSAQALPLDADNQAYLNSLLETFAAFVRMRAPLPTEEDLGSGEFEQKPYSVQTDVEAAIRIISRTFTYPLRKEIDALIVNLRNCYLPDLEMPKGADMRFFNLSGSVLSDCNLWHVNLSQSDLSDIEFGPYSLSWSLISNTDVDIIGNHIPIERFNFINSAIWNPSTPPHGIFADRVNNLIEARTIKIRENKLLEEYLAEWEKDEGKV